MDCSQHPADHRRMGIYSHLTTAQLQAKRDTFLAALEARLTLPTMASGEGRSVQFAQTPADLERQLRAVNEELARRAGSATRGPIYLA